MPPLTTLSGLRQSILKQCEGKTGRNTGRNIGLLGGSFNPAHHGHYHISLQALKKLQLDQLWWIVSSKNPLKTSESMADFDRRYASAKKISGKESRITVLDIEEGGGWHYSHITLSYLCRAFPEHRFVLIMGGDIIGQFTLWRRWQKIAALLPLAFFARNHAHSPLLTRFAWRYRRFRLKPYAGYIITQKKAPCWVYVSSACHPSSATSLRKQGEWIVDNQHSSRNKG